jgi:hypothetical protein
MMAIKIDHSIIRKIKSTKIKPPQKEVKGEGLISCDAISNRRRQISLESVQVHVIKVDHYIGFYELFILWMGGRE